MPGHKYGRFSHRLNIRRYASYDITEIPGADNIKKPEGIIKESIAGTAAIYGSKTAFYLTNGTTSGIHAVMKYVALKGGKILLSRDCHISAVNGAILFGVEVIFITTEYINGMSVPASPKNVAGAIERNPDACAVMITSPNYYGKTADISKIAKITHSNDMFLIVDEAHGSHFAFAGLENLSGINCGADIVCHSLHKTLPVYNQGAVLHICSKLIDVNVIRDSVNMLGTTSPSYPLLASMEKAVRFFSQKGKNMYGKLNKDIQAFKETVESDTACSIIKNDDYSRIVIETSVNGFEAAGILHEKFHIDIEAADFSKIICIATPQNKKNDFRMLSNALKTLGKSQKTVNNPDVPGLPEIKIPIADAHKMKKEPVPVDMAEGCICGTIIVSYPPGTPLICPGEIISGYAVNYIKKIMNAGGTVLGIESNKIPVLEQT